MPADMELSEFVGFWLENYKKTSVKESTYSRLLWSRDALRDYPISDMKITDITVVNIQQYINQIVAQGYSLSTVKKMARIVITPLRFAAAHHWILCDPSAGIAMPSKHTVKAQKRDVDAYSQEEQKKIRAELESFEHAVHMILLFILEEGTRPGEAIALNWSDINFQRNSITISKTYVRTRDRTYISDSTKTQTSTRTIPMTPRIRELLSSLKVGRQPSPDDPVFIDVDGKRIMYNAVRYWTKHLCKKVGVPYKGVHVFRHTFATNCYYKGIDIKMLSRMLGHASVQITYDTYINLYGDGFEDLNAVFG